jgi:Arc/MetJ-type ribon-helix-helix transcriptional regulator
MPQKRTHVVLPEDLLAEIDRLVGPRGRSAFLVEVLREEVRRRRLLQILSSPEPFWKDEDHPELSEGAEQWVRKMRDQDLRLEQEKLGDWVGRTGE